MSQHRHDFLLLQTRNFGDAVIGTGLVEALGRSFPGAGISVFTKPQFRSLYANNPYVSSVHTADFPMGTGSRFGGRAVLALLREVWALRRRRFKNVAHLGGDFRENLIGWLISPSGTMGPGWAQGHPFHRLIRDGLGFLRAHTVPVDLGELSIYAVQEHLATALGATAPARPRLYAADGRMIRYA